MVAPILTCFACVFCPLRSPFSPCTQVDGEPALLTLPTEMDFKDEVVAKTGFERPVVAEVTLRTGGLAMAPVEANVGAVISIFGLVCQLTSGRTAPIKSMS